MSILEMSNMKKLAEAIQTEACLLLSNVECYYKATCIINCYTT